MATLRSRGERLLTTLPSMTIWPRLISSSPAIIRRSVDLPQPEGPTRATNSPSSMREAEVVDDLERAEGLLGVCGFLPRTWRLPSHAKRTQIGVPASASVP